MWKYTESKTNLRIIIYIPVKVDLISLSNKLMYAALFPERISKCLTQIKITSKQDKTRS